MATNFTGAWALRNIIVDNVQITDDMIQRYGLRRDQITLYPFFKQETANGFIDELTLSQIENVRNTDQSTVIQVSNKRTNGTGTSRVRIGTGSDTVSQFTPSFFDGIQEGIDLSYINNLRKQYGPEYDADLNARIAAAQQTEFNRQLIEVFRMIYDRLEGQFYAWLESEKWALNTLADAGTIYTTYVADAKRIPAADATNLDWLQNVNVETMQNNWNQFGNTTLVHSPTSVKLINDYMAQGAQNDSNKAQFIASHDYVGSNKVIDGAGVRATFYEIVRGSVGTYNRVVRWVHEDGTLATADNPIKHGEDLWYNLEIGGNSPILTGFPAMKLEVKEKVGYADTSATYPNNDEANIDIVRNMSFFTQHGAAKAYAEDASESPIIKHEVLQA